ncbi:MAG: hypothetical protein QXV17_11105 [Candidatus Micrarchaeaceae archaeon]
MKIDQDFGCLKYDGDACRQEDRTIRGSRTSKTADVVCFRITKCQKTQVFIIEKTTSKLSNVNELEERIRKIEDTLEFLRDFSGNGKTQNKYYLNPIKIIICDGMLASVSSWLRHSKYKEYNILRIRDLDQTDGIIKEIARYVNDNFTK